MSYQLFRLPHPDAALDDGVLLGSFDSFDAALERRDDDAVNLLADTGDGQVMMACHQIVGAQASGRPQAHPLISAVARRIDPDDPSRDLIETRRWLSEIHRTVS